MKSQQSLLGGYVRAQNHNISTDCPLMGAEQVLFCGSGGVAARSGHTAQHLICSPVSSPWAYDASVCTWLRLAPVMVLLLLHDLLKIVGLLTSTTPYGSH